MFDAGCSPALYQLQGKSFNFPDMTAELCPQCKADYLRKHGYYERDLVTLGFAGYIIIRRYHCRECNRTVSLLPSFCHPGRTYGLLAIFGLLAEYYIAMSAACLAAARFLAATGIECSRQLLRHYRRRIEENLKSLVMAIISTHALRAPPVTEKVDTRRKVRQFLSTIQSPQDSSLKMFEQTNRTYLTHQPS